MYVLYYIYIYSYRNVSDNVLRSSLYTYIHTYAIFRLGNGRMFHLCGVGYIEPATAYVEQFFFNFFKFFLFMVLFED